MADIQTVADRLEVATVQAENAASTLDQIVEGDSSVTVTTDGGRVLPSIEKWYTDNFATLTTTLNAQVTTATTKASEAAASATESKNWAETDEDVLVPEGNLVDEYSAKHHRNKAEDAQTASETARDNAATSASNASDSATESQNWANSDEDVLVPEGNLTDEYSAKHHAIKSGTSATESKNWANYPEDTLVPEGNLTDEYSAKHHRNKAEDAQSACEAIQASLAQGVNYGGDFSAVAGTTPSDPSDGSILYRISAAGTINSVQYEVNDFLYFDQDNDVWRQIKNGSNISLADLNGVSKDGDTISGQVIIETSDNSQLVLRVPNGEANDISFIDFLGASASRNGLVGFNGTNMEITKNGGASLTITDTNAEVDGNGVWHEGNFDPQTFSTNPTFDGIIAFSSDEENSVDGSLERIQDGGDTVAGASYKTVLINGGKHNDGAAYNSWIVDAANVDAQGIILSSDGFKYAVANAATNGETVSATVYDVYHSGFQGSGSGLDADLVRGVNPDLFARLDEINTFTNEVPIRIESDGALVGSRWEVRVPDADGDFNIVWHDGTNYTFTREIRYDWGDSTWSIAGGLALSSGDLALGAGTEINATQLVVNSGSDTVIRDYGNGNVAFSAVGGAGLLGYENTTDLELYSGSGSGVNTRRGYVRGTNGEFVYEYDVDFANKARFTDGGIVFETGLSMDGNSISNVPLIAHSGSIGIRPNGSASNALTITNTEVSTGSGINANVGGVVNQTENALNTFAGEIKAKSFYTKYSSTAGFILNPAGAFYSTSNSSVTGAIKIAFPTAAHGAGDMLTFCVDIFDYTLKESVTLFIAGYLYQVSGQNEWVNPTVTILSPRNDKDYTVRFGADGSRNCLWIGETDSVWGYPQVVVRDLFVGYNANADDYRNGWVISISNTFGQVNNTVTSNYPVSDRLKTARTISLAGDLTGSASFDGSTNISINTAVNDYSHLHTIANVDGLQNALNSKMNLSGNQTYSSGILTYNGSALRFGYGEGFEIKDGGTRDGFNDTRLFNISDTNPVTDGALFITSDVSSQYDAANNIMSFSHNAVKSYKNFEVVGNITVSGNVDGYDVSAMGSKLAGIANNANNYTHPTYAGDDINVDTGALTGAVVVSDIDFNVTTDSLGHVTDANGVVQTRTLTLADLGYTGATNANNYTHPTYAGDDINIDTGALSGATVISDLDFNVTTDSQGHVTDANATIATRNLTASDIGALGASATAANSNQLGGRSKWTNTTNWGVIPEIDTNGYLHGMYALRFRGTNTTTDNDWILQLSSASANSHLYFYNDAGTLRYEFLDDGTFRADGNVIGYYSDIRLKDVEGKLENCMDAINQWEPIRYTATKEAEKLSNGAFKSDKYEIGLSAQSVELTHPEVIHDAPFDRDEKGESISGENYKTIDYSRTIPVLVGALQEKDKQINDLEARLAKLEKLVEGLIGE